MKRRIAISIVLVQSIAFSTMVFFSLRFEDGRQDILLRTRSYYKPITRKSKEGDPSKFHSNREDSTVFTSSTLKRQNRTEVDKRTVIIFLHIHKCAGSFFINLIRSLPNQRIPRNNGLLLCPSLQFRSASLTRLCGTSLNSLLPFWTWPAAVQEKFFKKLQYTFVANERWLGQELASDTSAASPSLNGRVDSPSSPPTPDDPPRFKHVTIIRHPLDRIASHFHYAQRYPASALYGRNLSFSSFVRAGPCRVPDAGFACWDANHYVQVARPQLCKQALTLPRVELIRRHRASARCSRVPRPAPRRAQAGQPVTWIPARRGAGLNR
jgi:hypothetical protein